jgi:serine/threonine protein kinase
MPEEFKDKLREISGKLMPTQKFAGGATEQRKAKTSRIPKPAPRDPEEIISATATAEEPVSTETITLKKTPLPEREAVTPEKRALKITCYHCVQKLDLTDMVPFEKVRCPSCNVEIIIPKWFDNYLLEESGGVGGMAIVYRALDLTLDREVAIKVLKPDLASKDERSHLFLHEARTAATINHYAVLPIYTCGEFENQPYIVMQYMDGGSLDKKLEENKDPLPLDDVVKWIRDIAEGLDNARRHGIIHHDIKPANIMLDKDGNVKIGDFGISQALRDSRSESIAKITKSWGSPFYISPEKVLTGKEDHMGDVYSLGASFYQLLTKHTPFEIDDLDRLVRIRTEQDPPSPIKHRPDLPDTISDLAMRMLSRSPEERPTYRDIINTLNTYMKEHEKKRSLADRNSKTSEKGGSALRAGRKLPTGGKSDYPANVFGGNILKTAVSIVVFSAVLIVAAYLLWQHGMFDKLLHKGGKMPPDLATDVTAMFKAGDCRQAEQMAEKILDDGTAKLAARKQAAIQMAFAKYLLNAPEAEASCTAIYERLVAANVHEDDFHIEILRYLGGTSNSTKTLEERANLEGNRYFAVLAAHAIYFRSVYEKTSGIQLMNYSNKCLSLVSSLPQSEFWGAAWKNRIPIWKDWTEFGKGDPAKLEKSIADYKNEVKEITPKIIIPASH